MSMNAVVDLTLILKDGKVWHESDQESELVILQLLKPFFPGEGSTVKLRSTVVVNVESYPEEPPDIQLVDAMFKLVIRKDLWNAHVGSKAEFGGDVGWERDLSDRLAKNSDAVLDGLSEEYPLLKYKAVLNPEILNFLGMIMEKDYILEAAMYLKAASIIADPDYLQLAISTEPMPEPVSDSGLQQILFSEYVVIILPETFNTKLLNVFGQILTELAAFSLPDYNYDDYDDER